VQLGVLPPENKEISSRSCTSQFTLKFHWDCNIPFLKIKGERDLGYALNYIIN
jgi:hypothetical protein